jgi:hypothetical protein
VTRDGEGFWQVVHEPAGDEEVVAFRDTTTAIRPALGFSILTADMFIELRSTERRRPPQGWPPTDGESVAMLRAFSATAGLLAWTRKRNHWHIEHTTVMASDPRLEGRTGHLELRIESEQGICQRVRPDGAATSERWRKLSGAAASQLGGSWQSGEPSNPWVYLVTAGHYGVMFTSADRPRLPANGEEFTDEEMLALWAGFGANVGARLETAKTFDHWPMLAQVAGYEVRKHETFRLADVHADHFTAYLPPFDEGQLWRRRGP